MQPVLVRNKKGSGPTDGSYSLLWKCIYLRVLFRTYQSLGFSHLWKYRVKDVTVNKTQSVVFLTYKMM